jgi:hypothetical protein
MVEHEAYTVPKRWPHAGAGAAVSLLQVVCAWCQQHIVWHQVQTPLPFPVSYSICAHCYADVAREFEPLTAGAVTPGMRA